MFTPIIGPIGLVFTRTSTVKYKFRHGSSMIPHPDKVSKGGEDALYAHDNILAVADGVGGWA
jgi:protein phosphatase PTC7